MKVYVVIYEQYDQIYYKVKTKVFASKETAKAFMATFEFNYKADGFLTSEPIETEIVKENNHEI